MIASSSLSKLMSLAAAVAIVIGVAQFGQDNGRIEIEGGGHQPPAAMGTRFEDMAAGTLTAETAEETPLTPAATPPLEALTPASSEPIVTAPAEFAPSVLVPTATASAVPTLQATLSAPPPTEAVKSPATTTMLEAEEEEGEAPTHSARPRRKDPKLAEQAQKRTVAIRTAQVTQAKPQTQRGNAARNNTKGAQRAGDATKSVSVGQSNRAAANSGSAEVSTYPGKVMQRIARAGKPRVRSKGTTLISFAIAQNGQLAQAGIARSSGSAALDDAALALIRQAAPFPSPPPGAQRRFSIRVKGR